MTDTDDLDWTSLTKTLKPENSLGFMLCKIANAWQRLLREKLQALDLTHTQVVALAGLAWLEKKGVETTQSKLSQFTRMDIMTTSDILRSLEKKGFVKRTVSPRDSRARLVCVTPDGIDRLNQALPLLLDHEQSFFSALPSLQDKNIFAGYTRNLSKEHEA